VRRCPTRRSVVRRQRCLRPATASLASLLVILCLSRSAAAAGTFAIDGSTSNLRVHVGKTGLGSFAGHEHDAVTNGVSGEVIADFDDLSRSSVEISVDAHSLKIADRDESPEDVQKVQQTMLGPQVLDVARFPAIRFRSRIVRGEMLQPGVYAVALAGEFSLHGVTKPITAPVRLETQGNTLTVTGKLVVKQTDFGIQPISAGGGLVNVEDDVTITFQIVARLRTPP
jgi:polyisoprenoid-binding protein YceI